ERASERERSVRGGDAGRDQNQRRQDRGGVRRDAKQADVAVLDPVVPDVEGKADGSEAEAEDREPLAHVFGNDRRFKRRVAGGRERRGREAEPGNRFGWRALELAGKHRIAGPDEGAAKSEAVARERRAARDGGACAFGKKESRRSGEAERRADHMAGPEPLARERGRKEHDQQRPEIGDQARVGGRGAAEGGEIE